MYFIWLLAEFQDPFRCLRNSPNKKGLSHQHLTASAQVSLSAYETRLRVRRS